jgi:hypothetical protein
MLDVYSTTRSAQSWRPAGARWAAVGSGGELLKVKF